ncbi:MAG: alcohol dehydrogenase catalytic domain-containing protein [Candidatus Doudnabacteria bacterium]|nr:alcohol dehydrogenase catalytic domain-containing protein [Candidatus Doudnabacteria bacterium]
MKALVFDKSKYNWEFSRGFELVDVPEPVLGAGDEDKIIIKVYYAGVCGTDKGIWNRMAFKDAILNSIEADLDAGRKRRDNAYRIIGHEFFGEVKAVGLAVKDIKVGDMVACESHVVDNKCYQCLHGQKNVCTNEKILGISVDGGFAEYAKVPAQVAWKTDVNKIRPQIAAMQEPFGNAVHAASKVDLKDKTVAIFGLGPIAQFLVLIAKGLGAKTIIGVEPNDQAIEMGKKLGVDHLIKLDVAQAPGLPYKHNQQIIDQILKLTNGLGVDVAFEMAGFNDSVNNAIASVRRGGDVILFGLKTGDFVFEDFNKLVMKGITMHCVAGRQIWGTWEITKKLMEDKSNQVQEKLWSVLLNSGAGTILNIADYSKEKFEEMMNEHPKFLIKF